MTPPEWWETETDVEAKPGKAVVKPEPSLAPSTTDLYRAPKKVTADWVRSQLSEQTWEQVPNKRLNPYSIAEMSRDAARGLSKRAIMARAGYHVRTWSNWVKWAEEGQEPYATWYRCILISISSVEEELIDTIKVHTEEDWKAAKWLLEQLNKEEYSATSSAPTINIQGDVKSESSVNYFSKEEAMNVASILKTIGALPEPVVDAEVVEDE